MKNKQSVIIGIIIVAVILSFSIIFAIRIHKKFLTDSGDINDLYSISHNDDLTFSFKITDRCGKVLISEENFPRQPKIEQVSENVLGLTVQSGTGFSTSWTVYCDVESSLVSETFYYVLTARGDYVVYADYDNKEDKHSIVVRNIFDESEYCKTYELQNVSPVAGDFTVAWEWDDYGNVTVTYLAGTQKTETDITVTIPQKNRAG